MKNIDEIQIASRYVTALFSLSEQESAVDAVEKDLRDLARAAHENKQLAALIENPLLNRKQQKNLIDALATSFKAHDLTRRFLITLAAQRRLEVIKEIARQFHDKAQFSRGEMSATVVTAQPLSEAEAGEVTSHLSRIYGKKINLTAKEDKTLLGGVVVKIGGVQLDSSLAGKLERMSVALRAA